MSLSPPRSGSDYDYEELEKEYGEESKIKKKQQLHAASEGSSN